MVRKYSGMSWIISRPSEPQIVTSLTIGENLQLTLLTGFKYFQKMPRILGGTVIFPDLRLAAILLTRSGLRVAAPWLLRVRWGGPGLLTVVTSCVRRKIFLLKSSSYYCIITSLKFSLPCGSSQMSQKNLTKVK